MAVTILLTGTPGSGKTTALKKILSQLTVKVAGFYTEEIRENGDRVGFKIVTLDGQEAILAHVCIDGQPRIGKYGVDLEVIEAVAVESLLRAQEEAALILIDEIGPMEILSTTFCQVVMNLLEADMPLLGSIVKRKVPFAETVRSHPGVIILEIRRNNQQQIVSQILKLLGNLM